MERDYELEIGDVVMIYDNGWGFTTHDIEKYVEVVGFDKYLCDNSPALIVVPYDCKLTTPASKDGTWKCGFETFGSNPMILLNTKDEYVASEPAEELIELLKLDSTSTLGTRKAKEKSMYNNCKVRSHHSDTCYTLIQSESRPSTYKCVWTIQGTDIQKETDYDYDDKWITSSLKNGTWILVTSSDAVNSPKHYAVFDGTEAIEIIASSLTQEEFRGYCFGNLLKYRLRCGKKDDVAQELNKADKYKELYEDYKHLCKGV